MKKILFYISLIVARMCYFALRVTKLSSGTAFIGLIVLKICPNFLRYANKYVTKSKINITGTNGKTTTSAITAHVLKKLNKDIIYNSTGANMLTGVVNSMSLQINPFKPSEYSVIEADEAHLGKIYDKFSADYLLVTNLFEDQLDRYGSLENTRCLIQKAIDKNPDLQLILNADDPFIVTMKSNKEPVFFGVESVTYDEGVNFTDNGVSYKCPCGKNLTYKKRFYSKMGHYSCNCGFKRPETKYKASIIVHKSSSELNINGENYFVPVMGLFNAYNAFAAIVMLLENGISAADIRDCITDFKVFAGRCEYKMYGGHKVLIQLIKNPVGATEVLKTVDLNSNILVAVNSNEADGQDISWINDAEFEILKDAKKEIVVSGVRAEEMAERLEKAGCRNYKILPDVKDAVAYISKISDNDITMLPNYTAYMTISKMKGFKKCC